MLTDMKEREEQRKPWANVEVRVSCDKYRHPPLSKDKAFREDFQELRWYKMRKQLH